MEKAKAGDVIECRGRKVIIQEIYECWYSPIDGWMIEGRDQNGRYFMWKQYCDGGKLTRRD